MTAVTVADYVVAVVHTFGFVVGERRTMVELLEVFVVVALIIVVVEELMAVVEVIAVVVEVIVVVELM